MMTETVDRLDQLDEMIHAEMERVYVEALAAQPDAKGAVKSERLAALNWVQLQIRALWRETTVDYRQCPDCTGLRAHWQRRVAGGPWICSPTPGPAKP